MVKCYLCQKETEKINSRVNDGGEEIVLDDLFKNEYVIKKGLFSKSKVVFCTSCDGNFEKLFDGSRTDGKLNTAFNTLTPLAIAFMNENKDNIINGDLSNLPNCEHCNKKTKKNQIMVCGSCNYVYCINCDADSEGAIMEFSDKTIDFLYDKFIEFMNSNSGMCPKCFDKNVNSKIVDLLKEKAVKISVSDIAAFLNFDRDFTKWQLDRMYKNKEIDFAGNGRYFILSAKKKKPKKAVAKKTAAVDVKSELKKYKEMLDEGLIDKEDYEAKKDKLLGI